MDANQSIIVTGGHAGLGYAVSAALARETSNTIVIACRDPDHARAAVAQLVAGGATIACIALDLGDQASVRRFVTAYRAAGLPPLGGIVANAGMQNVGPLVATKEGFETTFAVNHLGHYLLIRLLLADMIAGGRITVIASGTHDPDQKTGMPAPIYINADRVAHDFEPGLQAGLRRYTTSKLCNVLFAYELARRLTAVQSERLASIGVNVVDPGLMPATGLARTWPTPLRWVSRFLLPAMRLFNDNVHTPAVSGARVAALTTRKGDGPSGRYFANGSALRSSALSYDSAIQAELWTASARMTGLPIA